MIKYVTRLLYTEIAMHLLQDGTAKHKHITHKTQNQNHENNNQKCEVKKSRIKKSCIHSW